jgi:lysyl-tRNA synthetase class 2
MNRLHGRVIDSWRTPDALVLIFATEDRLREIRAPLDSVVSTGDVVRLALADEHTAQAVERLAGPRGAFDPEGDALRWRRPGSASTRVAHLRARQTIARAVRAYLDGEGFLEVQTPLLVPSTCPDVHIRSFRVGDEFLVTSTEYQLKRLVAGGVERLYSLTQNFRAGEVSDRHNPEFTMLEWARAFEPLDAIEADAERLVAAALAALAPGESSVTVAGRTVRLVGEPWERLTVRQAFARHLGVHVDESFSAEALRAAVASSPVRVPPAFLGEPHDTVSYLVDELQAHLGWRVPTFLREWPAFMTSSARLEAGRPALAERSELFIGGMEIADGFPSLQDPERQRELFAREAARRVAAGLDEVRADDRYVAALDQGLPPGAGMALGFDRLVMVLTGARSIRDVLAFAWDER